MKHLSVHTLLSVSDFASNLTYATACFPLGKDIVPFDSMQEFLDSEYSLTVEKETLLQYLYQQAPEGTIEKYFHFIDYRLHISKCFWL